MRERRSNSTARTMTRFSSGIVLLRPMLPLVARLSRRPMLQRALPPGPRGLSLSRSVYPLVGEPLEMDPIDRAPGLAAENVEVELVDGLGESPGVIPSSSMAMIHMPMRAMSSLSHIPSRRALLMSN